MSTRERFRALFVYPMDHIHPLSTFLSPSNAVYKCKDQDAFGYESIVGEYSPICIQNMFPGRLWSVLILLNLHVYVSFVSGLGPMGTSNTDLREFQSVHVGVVLNMDSVVGSMADICLSMALDDFYDLHYD